MLICCAIAVSTANAQTENYFDPKKGDFAIEIFIVKNVSISAAFDLGVQTSTYKSISKYDTDDRGVTNEEIDTNNYNKTTKKVTELATGMMNGNVAFNFYF